MENKTTAKLILKSPYIKGGKGASEHMNYIATREGVEMLNYISTCPGMESSEAIPLCKAFAQRLAVFGSSNVWDMWATASRICAVACSVTLTLYFVIRCPRGCWQRHHPKGWPLRFLPADSPFP